MHGKNKFSPRSPRKARDRESNRDLRLNPHEIRWFLGIVGFWLGCFGAYYIQAHWYHYFPYNSLCFFGIHIHHLYTGLILMTICGIGYWKSPTVKGRCWWLFFFFICLGIAVDDATDHWLWKFDPFQFGCR